MTAAACAAPGPVVLERVARNAALGLRFQDIATGETAVDGLRVEVFRAVNPYLRTVATPGPGGVYVAHRLAGLVGFEFTDADPPQSLWPAAASRYRVEVSDPQGRYLPIGFDADLPARGVFTWLAPWLSPPQAVVFPPTDGSPPPAMAGRIPLFSAPSRPVPEPLAAVYAQLADQVGGLALAWGLIGVSIDGAPRGLGLSDASGRVAVLFPYPEPRRPFLPSPVPAHDDFGWDVELTAWGATPSPGSPGSPPPPFADLAQVLESADGPPRTVVVSLSSPPLPPRLAYRRPLVVRTAGAAGADASLLFVA